MFNSIFILIGKFISLISKTLNLGSGSTWPGHIALMLNKNFIKDILNNQKTKDPASTQRGEQKLKIILIAGTNGKTTTGKLIQTILEQNGKKVFQNQTGANLLNGIASSILLHSSIFCTIDYDFAIFEVDENSLPLVLNELTPDYLILLNLFRDQLDRYGEINIIAQKWQKAIQNLPKTTTLILNADDPQIAYLDFSNRHPKLDSESHPNVLYFGLNDKKIVKNKNEFSADSTYCPNCNSKLKYQEIYFSHLGDWECLNCKIKRPKLDVSNTPYYPLPGAYNMYNTHASLLFAKTNNINNKIIEQSLRLFTPAFGRQEELEIDGKRVKIFLSKNPTSFNESLRTIKELGGKNLFIVLNDRIPDGRDVSWIWDTNIEELVSDFNNIIISGDRAFDMGLRLKYASSSQIKNKKLKIKNSLKIENCKLKIYENLKMAINEGLKTIEKNETLFILPTYSAMLEVRKILTGKKML